MSDLERVKKVFEYLKSNKYFRNQQDFVERIGSDKATVSQILNGKKEVSKQFVCKVAEAFPVISEKWLNGDDVDMLNAPSTIVAAPSNAYQKQAVEVELSDVIKSQRSIISSQQSTINKLTDIIYEMTQKKS